MPVSSAGGSDAPLIRSDEEPMDIEPAPEAEPGPLPFSRLFGGGGSNVSPPVPKPRESPASLPVGAIQHRADGDGLLWKLQRPWRGLSRRNVSCQPARDG